MILGLPITVLQIVSLLFTIYPMIEMPALRRWECGMVLNGHGSFPRQDL